MRRSFMKIRIKPNPPRGGDGKWRIYRKESEQATEEQSLQYFQLFYKMKEMNQR